MKKICLVVIGLLCISVFAEDAAEVQEVNIDISAPMRGGQGLSTIGYRPMKAEEGFLKKVTEKKLNHWVDVNMPPPMGETETPEQKKAKEEKNKADRKKLKDYTLTGQAGKYVGWFGIVREIKQDKTKKTTTLLLENKYFDGLTDSHIQIVSLYGAGDFKAVIPKLTDDIMPLQLIRVYGNVVKGEAGLAQLKADYVRVWYWGLFSFMDYGVDKSNKKWVDMRSFGNGRIYDSRPDLGYYTARIGERKTFAPKEYLYLDQLEKGFELFKAGAEKGDPEMQYWTGLCYFRGLGVTEDHKLAVQWYTKAAGQGYDWANYALAVCYVSGKGVDKNEGKAVEFLEKAANKGLDSAQYALGYHYFHGIGVEKNENKAREWFEKAARQGNRRAQQFLEKATKNETEKEVKKEKPSIAPPGQKPDWVDRKAGVYESPDGKAFFAVGTAKKSSSKNLMRMQAKTRARVQLARIVSVHLQSRITKFVKLSEKMMNLAPDQAVKAFTDIQRQMANNLLVGSESSQEWISKEGKQYVEMKIEYKIFPEMFTSEMKAYLRKVETKNKLGINDKDLPAILKNVGKVFD